MILVRSGSLMLHVLEGRVGHTSYRVKLESSPASLFTPPCLFWLLVATTRQLDSIVLMVSCSVFLQGRQGVLLR